MLVDAGWFKIVREGAFQSAGMVAFGKEVSQQDAADIRAYVIFRANQSMSEAKAAATKAAGDTEKPKP